MYKRLLIPLDGSSLPEYVLPYARHIAETIGSEVVLVSAVEAEEIPESVVPQVTREREACLERVAASMPGGLKTHCIVKPGHPAEVIIEQAGKQEDTLIVMATHGYSGIQRWFLGSIAHKVLQMADAPVLLLPARAMSPEGGPVVFERVIIPLDGSPLAETILPHVISLCDVLGMELILVRAYLPKFPGSTIRMHEVSEIVHDAAENYLKDKAGQLVKECKGKVSYEVLRGIPAEQITDFARATPNSITAMSTHGRYGVGRWVLGSVTDAVVHSSEEPVLVVRAPRDLKE